MYHKDKSVKLSIRLNEDQYSKVLKTALAFGCSTSAALRIILDSFYKEGQLAFFVADGVRHED